MGDFFDFENLMNHLHGALNHFPIALLFVSSGLDFVAGKRPNLRSSAWLLLVLGTLGAIAATVSGLLRTWPTGTTRTFSRLWRFTSTWPSPRRLSSPFSRPGPDVGGNPVCLALRLLGA